MWNLPRYSDSFCYVKKLMSVKHSSASGPSNSQPSFSPFVFVFSLPSSFPLSPPLLHTPSLPRLLHTSYCLHSILSLPHFLHSLIQWVFSCDSVSSLPNVGFVLNGNTFELTPNEYILKVWIYMYGMCQKMSVFSPFNGTFRFISFSIMINLLFVCILQPF